MPPMSNWTVHRVKTQEKTDVDTLIGFLNELDIPGIEEHDFGLTIYYQNNQLSAQIKTLCRKLGIDAIHHIDFQKEANWNEIWEKSYEPIQIESFCLIHAHFHQPHTDGIEHVIEITPQMSFGTGHHETTRLMINGMRSLNFSNKKVLDFGTGTGILAILADKLGSREITAIEHLDEALQNAEQNAHVNGCKNIQFLLSNTAQVDNKKFDIILVNIVRKVILENLEILASQLSENGKLLISGFLKKDRTKMRSELAHFGYLLLDDFEENNWCAQLYQKPLSA